METTTVSLRKRIFLIRHARPMVNKQGLFNETAARKYISDYDAATVEEFVMQHEALPYKEIKRVYCSSLIRSQLTAKAIFGEETEYIVDTAFREFERKIFSLPLVRLPIKVWLVSARILWFLGFNSREIETFRQARERVTQCATILEKEASQRGISVLVAHGMLNNFISRELRKRGWKQKLKGGSGFVSVNLFEKNS